MEKKNLKVVLRALHKKDLIQFYRVNVHGSISNTAPHLKFIELYFFWIFINTYNALIKFF